MDNEVLVNSCDISGLAISVLLVGNSEFSYPAFHYPTVRIRHNNDLPGSITIDFSVNPNQLRSIAKMLNASAEYLDNMNDGVRKLEKAIDKRNRIDKLTDEIQRLKSEIYELEG